ncbi:MAG: hypothetical protein O3C01_07865 [Bacteroidetes bacterium]|nr:hypothetical protein [Bacteroidota bacterium]
MRRKLCNDGSFSAMSYKYDIWTAKGLLRRKKETAEIIYNLIYLKIGMSYAGDRYYFKGYHCGWNEILRNIRGIPGPGGAPPWTFARKTYLQCIKPMIDREPKLEPKDWIRIFAPNQINKTEKINRVLIANFPPS